MHRLLKHQLKWVYGKGFDISTRPPLEQRFLDYISETYAGHDKERRHFEHTIDLNTSELNETNADIRKVLSFLSDAQRLSRTGSWNLKLQNNQLEWSQGLYRIVEMEPTDQAPQIHQYSEMVHVDDRDKADLTLARTLAQNHYDDFYRLQFADGRIKFVHEHREVVFNPDGKAIAVQGVLQDVTEQKNSENELRLYANVFRNSGESILICDARKRIISINAALQRTTGYALDDLKGRRISVLASQETPAENIEDMNERLASEGFWQGELYLQKNNGNSYPIWISISVIYNDNDEVTNYIASFTDISERKETEKRIQFLAHHDALTGLVNRFSFEDIVSQAILNARREESQLALLFIDMDRFKVINDTLGHQAGDEMLAEVAQRLKASVRASDIVGRLGGDEFVVCLTGLKKDLDALPSVHQILHRLNQPFVLKGTEAHSSPSIGIAVYPANGEDFETLMINADSAMYHAKEQGRNNHQFFSEALNSVANRRLELENALRAAIRDESFKLVYQPQIDTATFKVAGVEALLRWQHAVMGPISPDQFIPIAEETRLIVPLGEWVLQESCRQHYEWKQTSADYPVIAINISAQQLRSASLVPTIASLMKQYHIQPGELEIEVTESTMMENPDESIKRLRQLRELGIELAIDDFGTGYSSLAYLKMLPIHSLKLDRTFVNDLSEDSDDTKICSATLALAHNLGLSVVAEGVETEAQERFLVEHECEKLQGYRYSKPLEAGDVLAFIERQNRR